MLATCAVTRRSLELLMPQQRLDHPDVSTLLQKMGGKGVPEACAGRRACRNTGGIRRLVEQAVQLPRRTGVYRPDPGTTSCPGVPAFLARAARYQLRSCCEQRRRQQGSTVFGPFSLVDTDDHAVGIDIGGFQAAPPRNCVDLRRKQPITPFALSGSVHNASSSATSSGTQHRRQTLGLWQRAHQRHHFEASPGWCRRRSFSAGNQVIQSLLP